ncbi:MAG: tetratricopeptide repeat protein [Deltaproteobacteria bacterium]|nr:tetratricopeptide repeat protein [Deltaproteobacteria bacterium]
MTISSPRQVTATDAAQELQNAISQVLQQAEAHYLSGDAQAAEELYRGILEAMPNHPDAHHNLGVLLVLSQRLEEGLSHLLAALKAKTDGELYWLSYVEALVQAGRIDAAAQMAALGRRSGLPEAALAELDSLIAGQTPAQAPAPALPETGAVAKKAVPPPPGRGPTSQEIGKLASLQRKGKTKGVEEFALKLTKHYPGHPLGWRTLGQLLERQQRIDEALEPMRRAVALLPEEPEVLNTLGILYQKKFRIKEAEKLFKSVLQLKPDCAPALSNLGNLYRVQGRLKESETLLRQAVQFGPSATTYNNLGANLLDQRRLVEAEECYRQAIKLQPASALAHTNLGVCLRHQGRLEEAIASQRRALEIEPDSLEKQSHLLFTLNYTSSRNDASHVDEARKYGAMVKRHVKKPFTDWRCEANAARLRIGLVSGDLYNHPVGFFLESLMAAFDHDRIELIAYPTNSKSDDLTGRIKPLFAAWRPLYGLDDEAAGRQVHDDGVHILLDLAGHTSHNRLSMFGWKPAPVQASWLGYFATTGVEEIDYFLADEVGVPQTQQGNFIETLWYLPGTRLCFSPPRFELPVAPPPALTTGHVTFGCFQKLTKVGDEVLKVWNAILNQLPTARLRWQSPQFDDPAVVEQFMGRVRKVGIDPARITIKGGMTRRDYLAAHGEVDLILDTFPYPGGTTTCEALWMGVPTLTLAGDTLLSRQGASLLTAAGLPDWVADSEADYIAEAVAKATDVAALAALRPGLREQALRSPLFDASRFARNFEAALWAMWNKKAPQEKTLAPIPPAKQREEPVVKDQVMNFFNPVFWGVKDPAFFTDLMRKAAQQTSAYHFGDNMFVFQRNNSMLNDQPFMKTWKENAVTTNDHAIIWRRYILAMAGFHCQHLEGDFVECGAYQGVGAKTILDYLGGPDFPKTFWLYDLFEHHEGMVHHAMQGHGPQLYDQVVARFKGYPNVKIFKGELPSILEQGSPEKIAYLHIDLNQAPAEIGTLETLFDRVVPGGMIILDDYEMVFYRAQKLAEDQWFGARGYKVFPLPTSQGFVIKR